MYYYEAIVQGITEAFPVSSSLFLETLTNNSLYLVNLPICIVSIILFGVSISDLLYSIPCIIAGMLIELLNISRYICSPLCYLIISTIILVTSFIPPSNDKISNRNALIIGIIQGCSVLLDGSSRLGMTLIAGFLLGINRKNLYEFSWRISIPVFFLQSINELRMSSSISICPLFIIGIIFYIMQKIILNIRFQIYIYISLILRFFLYTQLILHHASSNIN